MTHTNHTRRERATIDGRAAARLAGAVLETRMADQIDADSSKRSNPCNNRITNSSRTWVYGIAAALMLALLRASYDGNPHAVASDSRRTAAHGGGNAGSFPVATDPAAPMFGSEADHSVAPESPAMKSSIVLTTAATMAIGTATFASNHVLSSATAGGGASIAHAAIQNAPISAGAMTIEFWVRYEGSIGRVVSKRGCSYDGYTVALRQTTGGAVVELVFGTSATAMVWPAGTISAHTWHHIALTWDAASQLCRFVVDGVQVATRTTTASEVPGSASNPLQFMEQCGASTIGAIDNIRIWSVSRTVSQIAADRFREYTASEAQSMTGLVGAWTFESGGIVDSAGRNPTGATYSVGAITTEDIPVPTIVSVPGDYPTIQSAIDSTPSGITRTINVAAGTYAGPIDFKGKSVVVKGAGAATTTLTGSTSSGSVVRMMSGEPSTARLEGFTITGGIGGTPLPSAPSALCGGGLLAINSAAGVVNCVFDGNAAPFGGGAYFLYCSGPITGCTFRQNNAQAYGGGFQLFGCTSVVQSCTVENNVATTAGAGIHLVLGNPTVRGTMVRNNTSSDKGGGISWDAADSMTATCLLDGSTILSNVATYSGGGIFVYPRPMLTLPYITATLASTSVCTNGPRNVYGPYLATGLTAVCDCAGDVNQDGVVNGADIGGLLAYWGPDPAVPEADVNHDGVVNGADLGLLLSNWGVCRP